MTRERLLHGIESPADLRRLPPEQLEQVAEEIRQEILECVSQTGGHLASSLGAVELITAIHYVFDTPTDRLVFDVGHQAYAHKMLTGRRQRFESIGQAGGSRNSSAAASPSTTTLVRVTRERPSRRPWAWRAGSSTAAKTAS